METLHNFTDSAYRGGQESGTAITTLAALGSGDDIYDREQRRREIVESYLNIGNWTPNKFKQADETYQFLPDLASNCLNSLEEDIKINGVLVPILTDEDGRILDGHNRAHICWENSLPCPVEVIWGLNDEEKKNISISKNMLRRQLTNTQKYSVFKTWYMGFSDENKPKQKAITATFAISQAAVSGWIKRLEKENNITCDNSLENITCDNSTADSGSSLDELQKTIGHMQNLLKSLSTIKRPDKCLDNKKIELWQKFFLTLLPKLHDLLEPFFTYQSSEECRKWFVVDSED